MLALSADARRALLGLLSRDRAAYVALETAAALHAGDAPVPPWHVASRNAVEHGSLRVHAPSEGTRAIVSEQVRIADLESTIVDLLARPTTAGALWRAGSLLASESVLERRSASPQRLVALAAKSGNAAAQRRVSWLLERMGLVDLAERAMPKGRSGVVKADPLGPAGGLYRGRQRLTVNAADGLPDRDGALSRALARWVRNDWSDDARALAARFGLGLPLSVARHADEEAVRELIARGAVHAYAGALRPTPPFDRAFVEVLATLHARERRRLADRLAARRLVDPTAFVDAALLCSDEAHVQPVLAKIESMAPQLDAERVAALLAIIPTQCPPRVRLALLERVGRWDEAAALVKGALDAMPSRRSAASRKARDQWALDAARIAWRRGSTRAAERALEQLSPKESRDRTSPIELDVWLLRATMAAEQAKYGRARVAIGHALAHAEHTGDELARARALHRRGTIAARRGEPIAASLDYSAALALLGVRPTALRGVLLGNLANMSLWTGEWDRARALAEEALDLKRAWGTAAEIANTRVLLARIARARGEPVPIGGRFVPLLAEVHATDDVRLSVEAQLDVAEELAREGDIRAALRAWQSASASAALLAGAEPLLDAWVMHVGGLLEGLRAGTRGDARIAQAIATIERAASNLQRLEGIYWAARARRDAASLAERMGNDVDVMRRLHEVIATCASTGIVLGEERAHVAAYALAALEGEPWLASEASRTLASIGAREVRSLLQEAGLGRRARALGERVVASCRQPVARACGPDGVRFIDAGELAKLRRGKADALVFDTLQEALIRADGAVLPLAGRRVLPPLLLRLIEAEGAPIAIDVLARSVWERRDASAHAAVKMAISRLRVLLGPLGQSLRAERAGGALAYAFTPDVPVWIVTPPTSVSVGPGELPREVPPHAAVGHFDDAP